MPIFSQGSFVFSGVRKFAIAGALMAGVACSPSATADGYVGANAGKMMFNETGVSDPTNAGVIVGREWGVAVGDVGVQAEFTTTTNKGEYYGNGVSLDTQALYAAFRTAGPVYLIAKAGMLREDVKIASISSTASGASAGAGLGFSVGVARLELEYTRVERDISYVSVGLRM